MARQVTWRRSRDEVSWNCKTTAYYRNNVNLCLSLKAGVQSNLMNHNAILQVMRPIPGTKKKEILLTREFTNSWIAKEAVDAVLTLCYVFYGKDDEAAEAWFLKTLSEWQGAPPPEQPDFDESYGTRIYKHYR